MLNVCPNVTLEVLELSKHYSGQHKLVLKCHSIQPRIKVVLVGPASSCHGDVTFRVQLILILNFHCCPSQSLCTPWCERQPQYWDQCIIWNTPTLVFLLQGSRSNNSVMRHCIGRMHVSLETSWDLCLTDSYEKYYTGSRDRERDRATERDSERVDWALVHCNCPLTSHLQYTAIYIKDQSNMSCHDSAW